MASCFYWSQPKIALEVKNFSFCFSLNNIPLTFSGEILTFFLALVSLSLETHVESGCRGGTESLDVVSLFYLQMSKTNIQNLKNALFTTVSQKIHSTDMK